MHIAMNRFEVANGARKQFEQSIKKHYEQLKGTRGYLSFHLIRGGTNGTVTFYSCHTRRANKEDFLKWGGEVQFRKLRSTSVNIEPVRNSKTVFRDRLRIYLKQFYFRT